MLDPDKAKDYAEQLSRFRFRMGDDALKENCRDVEACYATIIGGDEKISIMTNNTINPAFIALNPAAALDLAITILSLARKADWYGDRPVDGFATIQRRADAELERAKSEDLGSAPLGMNDPRLLASFRRNSDGSWTCIRKVRIETQLGALTLEPMQTFTPRSGLQMGGVDWGDHLEWMWLRPEKPQ